MVDELSHLSGTGLALGADAFSSHGLSVALAAGGAIATGNGLVSRLNLMHDFPKTGEGA